MPYAPGVVDRSGELLAAGRMDMARGLAQGIGAVGDAMQEYRQNKMRNSVLEGENEQLIKILSQDPELKKYVPEAATLDKLIEKKTTGGGLTLKDNMKLNAMLNTGLKVSKHVGDLKQQQAAAELNKQSAAQLGAAIEETMRQRKSEDAFRRAILDKKASGAPIGAKEYLEIGTAVNADPRFVKQHMDMAFEPDKIKEASELRAAEIAQANAQTKSNEEKAALAKRSGETKVVKLADGQEVDVILDANGNWNQVKPNVDPNSRLSTPQKLIQDKIAFQKEIRTLMEAGDPDSREKAFAIWTSLPGNNIDPISGKAKTMSDFEEWWQGMAAGAKAPAKDIIIPGASSAPLRVNSVRLAPKR